MDDDVQFIKPLNTLRRAKVGDGPAKLDTAAIARADAVVADMSGNYSEWVKEDLAGMQAVIDTIRNNPAKQGDALGRLRTISVDMKGQGATFGYRLITEIGDSLHKFAMDLREVSDFDLKVIASHMESMMVVMAGEIRDDGGPGGRELLRELHRLKEKAAGRYRRADHGA